MSDSDTSKPAPAILIVDDNPHNLKLLEAMLSAQGYAVTQASSGHEALLRIADGPDLVLLDLVMPDLSGLEVCRKVRESAQTRALPIVMITASGDEEKIASMDAGADDFLSKPINQAELLARVRSLLRVKSYHDTIQAQAAQLAEWNHTLEERVREQVEQVERLTRLRRFLSPQVAQVILSGENEGERLLESHRREITVVFCDLRGFTPFAETAEPEEVMEIVRTYHRAMGELVFEYGGTLKDILGDGMMAFFNDPVPVPDPAVRAVTMAVAMRLRARELEARWSKLGHDLGFGVGIAQGYATLGRIGFEGRFDYGAVGSVVNLASRLCGEAASGEILVSAKVQAAVEHLVLSEPSVPLLLKGFHRPIAAHKVIDLKPADIMRTSEEEGRR